MNIRTKETAVLDHIVLAEDVSVVAGQCLKMGEGGLVACAATDKPEFISNTDTVGDGNTIPCDKVTPDATLEGVLAADFEGLAVGVKLQLADDGVQLAAAVGGALEVLSFEGNTAGSRVVCRAV